MKFIQLNEYVDYIGIFKYILNKHLEEYPTLDEYLGNYLCGDYDDDRLEESKHLYDFLQKSEHFLKSLQVNYQDSTLVNDCLNCEIWFDEIVENNYYCSYQFIIDIDKECFAEYWFS